ncbi:hypothetical protein MKW98_030754 [Papaver atlanticum]|uniref:Alpha-D-phosphohexomutase alpha/beta/alpha domain-containing protein n=1 Tax=Papaver atlanticum TaxID=357466 RepID=A0AAD4S1F1_9MAGN|nr:hypothetical protein MKW98_030754 [Papaver atlanticum]
MFEASKVVQATFCLRKKVEVFKEPHNLQNFVLTMVLQIVVSGEGRHWSDDAIQIITKMAAADGVRSFWVGLNGLMSTPAVSAVIRERIWASGSKASGAFKLTASHNPGGAWKMWTCS